MEFIDRANEEEEQEELVKISAAALKEHAVNVSASEYSSSVFRFIAFLRVRHAMVTNILPSDRRERISTSELSCF